MNEVQSQVQWEYAEFVFSDWQPPHSWVCLVSQDQLAAPVACDFLWQVFEQQIRDELQEWQQQGWEYLAEVSPKALELRRTEFVGSAIDPSDVVLWIVTLGFGLLVHLLMGQKRRHYVRYEPLEFRVPMRRSVAKSLV